MLLWVLFEEEPVHIYSHYMSVFKMEFFPDFVLMFKKKYRFAVR